MKADRFQLEQQILECWRITDDIQAALRITDTGDSDRIQNVLIGIKELYTQKFEDLWDTFEQIVHDQTI